MLLLFPQRYKQNRYVHYYWLRNQKNIKKNISETPCKNLLSELMNLIIFRRVGIVVKNTYWLRYVCPSGRQNVSARLPRWTNMLLLILGSENV